ncbi:hypothetical protein F5Y10DRAFT_107184 [Nemania abortiva]|nr:hypothetical protein F5Y10DRAFT_107184 [Nemania abortiva]
MPSPLGLRNYLPSRADPDHRQMRKELEKKHSIGYKQVVVLGLLGVKLAWNIEQQVKKHEEKRDREEAEQRRRHDQERQRRERAFHERRFDPRRDYSKPDDSTRAQRGSWTTSENYSRETRRYHSPDYRVKSRHSEDQPRDERRRYHSQDSRQHDGPYHVTRSFDQTEYIRRRRDSTQH